MCQCACFRSLKKGFRSVMRGLCNTGGIKQLRLNFIRGIFVNYIVKKLGRESVSQSIYATLEDLYRSRAFV